MPNMALDRWLALIILLICLAYGYAAFFTMDAGLPPVMKFNPIWPSTFPKVLSVLGAAVAFAILIGVEKSNHTAAVAEINYRKLTDYKLGQTLALLALMVIYAFALRPAGFLVSTAAFLILSAVILGERRWAVLLPVAAVATGAVWWLVDRALGVYLRPLPFFMGQ